MQPGHAWYVLGFDYDDVVGCWQDWRLARECVDALRASGSRPGDGILEGAGQGQHLTYWYVSDEMARFLDGSRVGWRRFVVGLVAAPPASATRQLKLD